MRAVPSLHSKTDLGRVGYFEKETKPKKGTGYQMPEVQTVKDKYRTEHDRIFGDAQPPSGAPETTGKAGCFHHTLVQVLDYKIRLRD